MLICLMTLSVSARVNDASEIVPFIPRMQEDAFVYVDNNFLVCRAKVTQQLTVNGVPVLPVEQQHCSWLTVRNFGYGTYTWQGKIFGCDYGEEYPGGFENHHGFPLEGLITFLYCNGVYSTWTTRNGWQIQTVLNGQNWTTLRTFKITWALNYIYFYVDNGLVSTHNIVMPNDGMGFFFEACTYRGKATAEAGALYNLGSFTRLG